MISVSPSLVVKLVKRKSDFYKGEIFTFQPKKKRGLKHWLRSGVLGVIKLPEITDIKYEVLPSTLPPSGFLFTNFPLRSLRNELMTILFAT